MAIDFTSGFVSTEEIEKDRAESSSGIADKTRKELDPTGDMYYDFGQSLGRYFSEKKAEKTEDYKAFKKRHVDTSVDEYARDVDDKKWMYKKWAKEKGESSKDIRRAANEEFNPQRTKLLDRITNPAGAKRVLKKMGERVGGDIKSAQDYIGYADALVRGRVERKKKAKQDERDFNISHEQRIQDLRDERKELQSSIYKKGYEKYKQRMRDKMIPPDAYGGPSDEDQVTSGLLLDQANESFVPSLQPQVSNKPQEGFRTWYDRMHPKGKNLKELSHVKVLDLINTWEKQNK